jgi:hypothetical protein
MNEHPQQNATQACMAQSFPERKSFQKGCPAWPVTHEKPAKEMHHMISLDLADSSQSLIGAEQEAVKSRLNPTRS